MSFLKVTARRALLTACAALPFTLQGCFALLTTSGKESVSADIIGCDNVSVSDEYDEYKHSTWTAACGGNRYHCTADEELTFFRGKVNRTRCTPAVAPTYLQQQHAYWVPTAKVERAFDDQQGPLVRGEFTLSSQLKATLIGAPRSHPGRLLFTIDGDSHEGALTSCKSMVALINAIPTQPLKEASASSDTHVHVESSFSTDPMGQLAQRFPTFALELCKHTWPFNEDQVQELQKLLAIYADLSTQVRSNPSVDTTQL